MTLTRAEVSKRYDNSPKGQRQRKKWVAANKQHLSDYHVEWARKNREKANKFVSDWRKKNRKKYNAQIRRYQEANKEKFIAYRKMRKALKVGMLIRIDYCEQCKKQCKPDAHHHKGYEHPLEVLWLCRQCHVNQHPK